MSSISGLNASGIQFNGLASGLDTSALIQGLTALDQAKITRLTANQQKVSLQQTAFKTVETKLLGLQLESNSLARTFGNVFDAKTVKSSDDNTASATATSSAAAGVYKFHVNSLAQSHQVASQGFATATSAVGTGSLQIQVGTGATTTVNIGSDNATLQGLASAINGSGADVSASIVNDGDATAPFRLLLTAKNGGTANTINLTNNLTGGGGAQPDLTRVVQAGQNASITVGSGAGALTLTSATNQIDGAFQGVVISLKNTDKDVTLTVGNDTDAASTAVHGFVDSFNGLADYINTNTGYDPKTNEAGLLLGNSTITDIQNALVQSVTSVVPGVNSRANTLGAIGISLNDKGKLVINDAKLTQALSGQLQGVTTNDVRRLFGLDGSSTNAGVQFVSAGPKAQANGSAVAVNITQLATQGRVTAGTALDATTDIDGSHNQLTLKVDGRTSGTIALAVKTYASRLAVVQELQGKIDADTTMKGLGIVVGLNGSNQLTIASGSYGTSSQVQFSGGSALAALGFTGSESGTGVNAAGDFGGEAATGVGQFLTGNAGNATTDGLKVQVGLTQLPTNPAAQMTVTRGLASAVNQTIQRYLDPQNGRLHAVDKSLQDTYDDYQKTIERQSAALTVRQQEMIRKFAAMESTVSKLKNIGSSLSVQLTTMKLS